MYCSNCGAFVPEGSETCPNCSQPVSNNNYNAGAQQNSGTYYTPQYQQSTQNYYQSSDPLIIEQEMRNNLSTANTMGILAIILGFILTPIAGIICGIIGLSKANEVPDFAENQYIREEKQRVKKLNILGIVLPTALWIVAMIVMFICFFGVIFAGVGLSEIY